ncbi:DUF896 domain-containing protein [Paenibacillus alginolyticus]|uniref:UPF0291 protein M5X19_09070 n=1 Tax=Paenibacillus alginolyticus TaxID=59839 RepID=A0ABT4GA23_9BACL|nr:MULTISPECIES: DUF896 domain-containing protein [Paenibacillus]MCY9693045.1 DUF896 domain-containing protein [Paenibacillus alginolyticus]MEC0146169.1 DUF896 domain-containing protein [Paenibacillus alginolyticus]NRF95413.1 DUF896 domain-containing protein [Paenibacillus frigoriresistens]
MLTILNKINELSRKEKELGLTEIEKAEQANLRKEYLQIFRGSIDSLLLNSTIIDPNGDNVTPERLKQEQAKLADK